MKCLLLALSFCTHTLCATGISGNSTLHNQTNHAGIKLRFIQSSPTAVSESVLTDASGNYSISLAGGLYYSDLSMPGYQLHPPEAVLLDIGKLELEPGFCLLKISDCSGGNSAIKFIKEN